ncbi:hypothetical protein [Streptomyces sp. NPDC002132]|uniref:hypothetical protein n=1 Tax=unclassified Streptomyces TaxID=2593676 RepID=UPI003318A858
MAVVMENKAYPEPSVLLARLVQSQEGSSVRGGDFLGELSSISRGQPPTEEFLRRLASQVRMQSQDLYLVAGFPVREDTLPSDEGAGRELPELVRLTISLPPSGKQELREFAQSLPRFPRPISPRKPRPYERYPPGFGSLFVRMLALRNLGWGSAAKVMYLMSGVYVSAATIGAVGRGVKELDTELLNGFAAVLGIPVRILGSLTGMPELAVPGGLSADNADTAALLWDVRDLAAAQVRDVSRLAEALR